MPSTTLLPRAVRLAVWGNAWARSAASPDELADHVRGDDPPHLVAPAGLSPEPLIVALPPLLRKGLAVAVLPAPGFLDGLGGPPAFNSAGLDAGECVLIGSTGLVPEADDVAVVWRVWEANPARHTETYREAALHFRATLQQAARGLAALDAPAMSSGLRDLVADALVDVDAPGGLDLPPDLGPTLEETLASAVRCLHLTELALDDHAVDLSTSASRIRREALQPLDHAARRVLTAASVSGPRR